MSTKEGTSAPSRQRGAFGKRRGDPSFGDEVPPFNTHRVTHTVLVVFLAEVLVISGVRSTVFAVPSGCGTRSHLARVEME